MRPKKPWEKRWTAGSFWGTECLEDADGYDYLVEDYGQIYVSLETEQTAAGPDKEENVNENKN